MGVLDFLFEGKPPQSVTTYGQTVENIPKWMSDYTQGLIARANAAAAEPYIPYGGPRIAGFTPEQEAAFGLGEQQVGAYQPYLEGALGRAVGIRERTAPMVGAAREMFPEAVGRYMDPYVENVLARQEDLATRTLEEQFLPRLQRSFIGAGQIGSRGGFGSMEDIGVRGMRDIQEDLEKQRLATLSGAYGQAADIFGRDVQRQAELARTVGALEEAGMRGLADLGGLAQRYGMADIGLLEAIGQQRQAQEQRAMDLAYRDFLEQRQLPFERLGFMSDIIRGLPYSRAIQQTDVGPAQVYQPSPLQQAIGAYGVYRGLRGDAEGGYIEPERYAEGGYTGSGGLEDYVQEYGIGGLATDAWRGVVGLGKASGEE